MNDRRQRTPPFRSIEVAVTKHSHNPPPVAAPKREFAFSRVAGVSPSEYAAVSGLAVGAVVAAPFGLFGLLWIWWLAAPAVSILLALLSLYYIATSAGTLTGRKVALVALVISVVLGAGGTISQVVAYNQRQEDIRHVRGLAAEACRFVQAGDYESFYNQLIGAKRDRVPPAGWRFFWTRALGSHTQVLRADLSERTLVAGDGQVVINMLLTLRDPNWVLPSGVPAVDREVRVRLIYSRLPDQRSAGPGEQGPSAAESSASAELWQLSELPPFVSLLPPPYAEPLAWPGQGETGPVVEWLARDSKGNLETIGRGLPHAKLPAKELGREVVQELAAEPGVPYRVWEGPWLPQEINGPGGRR